MWVIIVVTVIDAYFKKPDYGEVICWIIERNKLFIQSIFVFRATKLLTPSSRYLPR